MSANELGTPGDASTSSTRKGTPSAACCTRATSAGARLGHARPHHARRHARRPRRPSEQVSRTAAPMHPADQFQRSGSAARSGTSPRTAAARTQMLSLRYSMTARVSGSAQCRSSSTTTSAPGRANRRSRRRTASPRTVGVASPWPPPPKVGTIAAERREPRRKVRVVREATITRRLEQRLGQRPIRCAGSTGDRPARNHRHVPRPGVAGHLANKPGLADARLAGHEHQAARAIARQRSAPPAARQAPPLRPTTTGHSTSAIPRVCPVPRSGDRPTRNSDSRDQAVIQRNSRPGPARRPRQALPVRKPMLCSARPRPAGTRDKNLVTGHGRPRLAGAHQLGADLIPVGAFALIGMDDLSAAHNDLSAQRRRPSRPSGQPLRTADLAPLVPL